jgi:hypothetical protein
VRVLQRLKTYKYVVCIQTVLFLNQNLLSQKIKDIVWSHLSMTNHDEVKILM